jgi:hypothetical protein
MPSSQDGDLNKPQRCWARTSLDFWCAMDGVSIVSLQCLAPNLPGPPVAPLPRDDPGPKNTGAVSCSHPSHSASGAGAARPPPAQLDRRTWIRSGAGKAGGTLGSRLASSPALSGKPTLRPIICCANETRSSPFFIVLDWKPPTGEPNRPSARWWLRARCGEEIAHSLAPAPKASCSASSKPVANSCGRYPPHIAHDACLNRTQESGRPRVRKTPAIHRVRGFKQLGRVINPVEHYISRKQPLGSCTKLVMTRYLYDKCHRSAYCYIWARFQNFWHLIAFNILAARCSFRSY